MEQKELHLKIISWFSAVNLQVSGDDDAKYTVKAVNSLGEATCTAELLVEVMAGEEEEEEE